MMRLASGGALAQRAQRMVAEKGISTAQKQRQQQR
jgi:hypothetical protein